MSNWQRVKLTEGTRDRRYHSHSYYDIPVFDDSSRYIATHEMRFAERDPKAHEPVEVGIVDTVARNGFVPLGSSHAWSWQQGPMAQWRFGSRILHWNDRQDGRFITRLYDLDQGHQTPLPRPTYAIGPDGSFVLSLNMARLDELRPGYGYPEGEGGALEQRRPDNDGVWYVETTAGDEALILSLDRAAAFYESMLTRSERKRQQAQQYHYWFNHAKISPDGSRFTVKLRFKTRDGSWNDRQGVSLTCRVDGTDLRLLAGATSHVIWFDNSHLYMWQQDGFYLYEDIAPKGCKVRELGNGLVEANAHLRYLPNALSCFVFDTPYRDDIDLYLHDEQSTNTEHLARFSRHRPRSGPYRCDVHPCPSPDGRKLAVTSVEDGGRQVYMLAHVSSDRDGEYK